MRSQNSPHNLDPALFVCELIPPLSRGSSLVTGEFFLQFEGYPNFAEIPSI
jgi:hypothetical protein